MRRPNLLIIGVLCLSIVIVQADWPDFRGPWHDGHASAPGVTNHIGLPLHWSESSNVVWKTAIPEKGWSSPVIIGKQVWLTTATADGKDYFAMCVDSGSCLESNWGEPPRMAPGAQPSPKPSKSCTNPSNAD